MKQASHSEDPNLILMQAPLTMFTMNKQLSKHCFQAGTRPAPLMPRRSEPGLLTAPGWVPARLLSLSCKQEDPPMGSMRTGAASCVLPELSAVSHWSSQCITHPVIQAENRDESATRLIPSCSHAALHQPCVHRGQQHSGEG